MYSSTSTTMISRTTASTPPPPPPPVSTTVVCSRSRRRDHRPWKLSLFHLFCCETNELSRRRFRHGGNDETITASRCCSARAVRPAIGRPQRAAADEPAARPTRSAPITSPPTPPNRPAAPDDRTPLAEPKGPIDPKSVEAAGPGRPALWRADRAGALGRSANALWGDASAAAAFDAAARATRRRAS